MDASTMLPTTQTGGLGDTRVWDAVPWQGSCYELVSTCSLGHQQALFYIYVECFF